MPGRAPLAWLSFAMGLGAKTTGTARPAPEGTLGSGRARRRQRRAKPPKAPGLYSDVAKSSAARDHKTTERGHPGGELTRRQPKPPVLSELEPLSPSGAEARLQPTREDPRILLARAARVGGVQLRPRAGRYPTNTTARTFRWGGGERASSREPTNSQQGCCGHKHGEPPSSEHCCCCSCITAACNHNFASRARLSCAQVWG